MAVDDNKKTKAEEVGTGKKDLDSYCSWDHSEWKGSRQWSLMEDRPPPHHDRLHHLTPLCGSATAISKSVCEDIHFLIL
jgi:hypothetical protein